MTDKKSKKTTETSTKKTKNFDKNTRENDDTESEAGMIYFEFHWYHYLALAIVILLVIIAGRTFFGRYDMSLVGSERMMRVAYGCTEGDGESAYRYFGINEGELYTITSTDMKLTINEDEANLRLGQLNGKPTIEIKNSDGWQKRSLEFGEEGVFPIEEDKECKPGIKIQLNI